MGRSGTFMEYVKKKIKNNNKVFKVLDCTCSHGLNSDDGCVAEG